MAYVPIPKDLNKVKTKVAFNLTKRQLIGFTLAGLVGIPVYLFMRKFVPNDIAVIFLIVSTLPIFFITLFEKDGLTFEKYFKHIYLHKFYQPKKRVRKERVFLLERRGRRERRRRFWGFRHQYFIDFGLIHAENFEGEIFPLTFLARFGEIAQI